MVNSQKLSRKYRTNRVLNPGPVVCESSTLSARPQRLPKNKTVVPRWAGLDYSGKRVASHAVVHWFAPRPGHTKHYHTNSTNCLPSCQPCVRIGVWQYINGTGRVWNCLWEHALKRFPGINRKSRALHSGPGFLASAIWYSMPKKHYNGLINQSINQNYCLVCATKRNISAWFDGGTFQQNLFLSSAGRRR